MGTATIRMLSGITAWLLAGVIALQSVLAFSGHSGMSLLPPVHWPAFLALGALAGLARRERRSTAAGGALILTVLVAVLRLPAGDTLSILADGFTLAVATMAGLHGGRAATLLMARRHP